MGFDSTSGTGKVEVSTNRTAPSLGRERQGGTLSEATVTRNQRRDAIDRTASVSLASGTRQVGGALLTRSAGDERNGANVRAGEATATATGSARVGLLTARLDGKVGAELNVVRADAVATRRVGGRELQVKAEGRIGAQANANGSIVFDPRRGDVRVGAGGEAFAGARAGVSGSFEIVPGIRLGGEGDVRAGIGAGANLNAGVSRGTFRFKGSLTGTLGVGAKLGGNVEINPGQTLAAARRASPALDGAIRTGQRALSSAPVRQTTAAVRQGATTALTSGRQLVRNTQALSARALDSGQRLAARARSSFTSFLSTPSPRARAVATAMSRPFLGGF